VAALPILLTLFVPAFSLAQGGSFEVIDPADTTDQEVEPVEPPSEEETRPEEEPDFEVVVRDRAGNEDPQVRRVERSQIERSPGFSLAEALEREPGVFAASGSRGEREIQIRGFEQRQIFIVIDGVPAYMPYDGLLDLGKIPAELIEDVVILRGPSSLRYGPGGMGGTLSIQTRRPGEGPFLSSRFELGRGLHLRTSLLHSARAGRVSWLVGGGFESREALPLSGLFEPTEIEDGGDREQSDRRLWHLVGRLKVDLSPGSWLEATAWYIDGEWGVPPSVVHLDPRFWRVTVWRATVATVSHRWIPAEGLVLQEQVFVGFLDNLLDRYDDASYSSQDATDSFHSWYRDLTAGGWARLRVNLPRASLLRVELGARYERHLAQGDRGEDREVSRVLILGAIQLESWLAESMRLVAAVQTEAETALDVAVAPSADAMLALRYEPEDRPFSLGFSVARRSRLPTLKERFSRASGVGDRLPNPDLQPEAALHLGLDATWQALDWLRLELSVFDAEVRDLIEQVQISGSLDQFQNVSRARLMGAEATLGVAPLRWLEVELAYRYLYARSLGDDQPGPLSSRPDHMARLSLRFRPHRRLEISTALRWVGSQQFQLSGDAWGTLGAYLAWDARIEGEPWVGVHIWIAGTNLLDANYQTKYGYPEPGWQLWGGVRMELERPSYRPSEAAPPNRP
jgi:iron complex outermembrane receptor protein